MAGDDSFAHILPLITEHIDKLSYITQPFILQPSFTTHISDFFTFIERVSTGFILSYHGIDSILLDESFHGRLHPVTNETMKKICSKEYVLYLMDGNVYDIDPLDEEKIREKVSKMGILPRMVDLSESKQHKQTSAHYIKSHKQTMPHELFVYHAKSVFDIRKVNKNLPDDRNKNTKMKRKFHQSEVRETHEPTEEIIKLMSKRLSKSVKSKNVKVISVRQDKATTDEHESIVNPLTDQGYERESYPTQETEHDTTSMFAAGGHSGGVPIRNIAYAFTPRLSLNQPRQHSSESENRVHQPRQRSGIVGQSHHPAYVDEDMRLRTYPQNWCHAQDPKGLAECGFFYTGRGDMVTCFSCGTSFKDWSSRDDPWYEHMKSSPECRFPESKLDPDIYETYKRQIREESDVVRHQQQQHDVYDQQMPQRPVSRIDASSSRYPKYISENVRLSSYSKWPLRSPTPITLAAAGLFYTGLNDGVRCFHCNGGMRNWTEGDDPWVEHARWFPQCGYVRQIKGNDYIRLVQLSAESQNEEGAHAPEITTGINNMTLIEPRAATGGHKESDNPVYTPAAQSVISMGFSKKAVELAIDECNKQGQRWNAEILANVLYDKLDSGEALPTESPRSSSPDFSNWSTPSTVAEYAQQNELLRKQLMCILCEEKESDILFLPCGHLRMCSSCATGVTLCTCGKPVKEKIKTYKP